MSNPSSITIDLDEIDKRIRQLRIQGQAQLDEADRLAAFKDQAVRFGKPSRYTEGAEPEEEDRRTRKQQIIDYLEKLGPHSRKDIAEATGIPDGTIAYEMRDRTMFAQLPDGRWTLLKNVSFADRLRGALAPAPIDPVIYVEAEEDVI